jgi:YidC/Oxa1 family membrane protein insertase
MLAPVELAQHLLSFLDAATRPLLGASSAWVAIVLLTVLVRVAMLPLAIAQLRAARAQTELQPEIAALRKRYAKRPERLQAAILDLYRERGVGVLAGSGCLPLLLQLVQLPVIWIVYRVVRASAFGGALFSVPLGTTLLAAPPPVLLALVGVLALAATLSAWQAGRAASHDPNRSARPSRSSPARRAGAAATAGQPGARRAATLARALPFAVIPVAAWLPLAVVVYMAAGNLFTVVQQAIARAH